MTKSEAVQRAYAWAFQVQSNRQSAVMMLYCAKQVIAAVEKDGTPIDVYDSLCRLVKEWRSSRRSGMERPVEILTRMLEHKDM